jgi:hypothetical protein
MQPTHTISVWFILVLSSHLCLRNQSGLLPSNFAFGGAWKMGKRDEKCVQNLPDRTSDIHTGAIFVRMKNFSYETCTLCLWCLHMTLQMPASNGPLFNAINPKDKHIFRAVAIFLYSVNPPRNTTATKLHIFRKSTTTQKIIWPYIKWHSCPTSENCTAAMLVPICGGKFRRAKVEWAPLTWWP